MSIWGILYSIIYNIWSSKSYTEYVLLGEDFDKLISKLTLKYKGKKYSEENLEEEQP